MAAVTAAPAGVVAAQRYRSDGFRRDAFLNRDDTNGYDESTLRAKGTGSHGAEGVPTLTLLYADLDNGYDAWSVDNTRVTQSNQPGRDAQRSSGASLRLTQATAARRMAERHQRRRSRTSTIRSTATGATMCSGARTRPTTTSSSTCARAALWPQDLRYIGGDSQLPFGRLRPVDRRVSAAPARGRRAARHLE